MSLVSSNVEKTNTLQESPRISPEDRLLRFDMSAENPKRFFDRLKLQGCT